MAPSRNSVSLMAPSRGSVANMKNSRNSLTSMNSFDGMNGDGMAYQGMTSRSSAPLFEGGDAGGGSSHGSIGGSSGNLFVVYETALDATDWPRKSIDSVPTQDTTPVSKSSRKKPVRTSMERATPNQLPSLTNNSTSVLPFSGNNSSHNVSTDGSSCVDIEAPAPSTIVV